MSRKIIVADSLDWLSTQRDGSLPNFVTGICDLDEIDMNMEQYLDFFQNVAQLIFQKMDPSCYAIFIQTDRKYQREWYDKSTILTNIAHDNGFKLVWHKIALHRDVDRTDVHRPTYAHMLCYTVNGSPGAATPDVLPVSKKLYKNGTPLGAAERAIEFIDRYSSVKTIIDPFVGQGTIPAIANKYGLNAFGIDIDPSQVDKAKSFEL